MKTGTPLVSFSFPYKSCADADFVQYPPDILAENLSLLGNLSSSSIKSTTGTCGISNGVREGNPVMSTRNVSMLRQMLSSTTRDEFFSVEMWIRPKWNLTYPVTIWSIGPKQVTSKGFADKCDNSMSFLQLPTKNSSQAYFVLVACANSISSGQELISPKVQLKKSLGLVNPIHIVINIFGTSNTVISGSRTSIKIGEIAANFTINGRFNQTDGSKYFFYSGSSSLSYNAWRDSDHLIVFPSFEESLNNVADPFNADKNNAILFSIKFYKAQADIPQRSLPVLQSPLLSFNKTEIVQENGEIGEHYSDPTYYESPVPLNELHTVCLGIFDFDLHPSSPNYHLTPFPASLRVFIHSGDRPVQGQFYYINGSNLPYSLNHSVLSSIIPWDESRSCYALRYRPRWNEYSTSEKDYDQIYFTLVSDMIPYRTHSLSIIVKEVPKPPIASRAVTSVLSRTTTRLKFSGIAYSNRTISAVSIEALPRFGDLLFMPGNGSTPVLLNDAMLKQRFPLSSIAYFYRGDEWLVSLEQDQINHDYFLFRVFDNYGLYSVSAVFKLNINTSITSVSTEIWGHEGVDIPISIMGQDLSDLHRILFCAITMFPQSGQLFPGTLLNHSAQNSSLSMGSLTLYNPFLPYPLLPSYYHLGVFLLYRSIDKDFFNFPDKDWMGASLNNSNGDIFRTALLINRTAFDNDPLLHQQSRSQYHIVHIQNVNDPTAIQYAGAKDITRVYAFGSNTKENRYLSEFALYNVTLSDADHGVDLVRVHIQVFNGGELMLSTSTNALEKLSGKRSIFFNQLPYCRESFVGNSSDVWSCTGDLFLFQKTFSFVSTVSTAQNALNGAIYRSTVPNIVDTIRISIFDGVGGSCLTETMHNNDNSLRFGCFESFLEIQVLVGEHLQTVQVINNVSEKRANLMSKLRYAGIGFVLLSVLLIVKWCWGRRRHNTLDGAHTSMKEYRDADSDQNTSTHFKSIGNHLDHDRHSFHSHFQTPPRKDGTKKQPGTPKTATSPNSTQTTSPKSCKYSSPKPRRHHLMTMERKEYEGYNRLACNSPKPTMVPTGWSVHRHQNGKVFYHNSRTNKSTWKRPKDDSHEINL